MTQIVDIAMSTDVICSIDGLGMWRVKRLDEGRMVLPQGIISATQDTLLAEDHGICLRLL
jgi:hypothetical protein